MEDHVNRLTDEILQSLEEAYDLMRILKFE